ncbi:hypothetical protein B0H21DRAFT_697823 [Amylocystis lapponica]|nr:hypothetical protein B0H21DRAFT_697823 [Amylocystis lapponica]
MRSVITSIPSTGAIRSRSVPLSLPIRHPHRRRIHVNDSLRTNLLVHHPHSGYQLGICPITQGGPWLPCPCCVVEAGKRIHSGHANIYLSTVNNDNCVVFKVSSESHKVDRLRHEADIYETFKVLQGDLIPRCYGYYEQKDGLRRLHGCLVLEFCGSTIEVEKFLLIPRAYKEQVIEVMEKIHEMGYKHCNFRQDNVVVDDLGKLRLLDFEYTDRHPGRDGCSNLNQNEHIVCGDDKPRYWYCRELKDVALAIGAWKPGALCNFE